MVFDSANIGCAQVSMDSLYRHSRQLKTAGAYDLFVLKALDSVRLYHELEEWAAGNRVLDLIVRLPYDQSRVEKFIHFVNTQSKIIESTSPIESAYIHSYVASWYARNGHYEDAHGHFLEASQKLYALKDTQYLHKVYYWFGQNYQFGRADGAQALICADQAERIYNLKKDKNERFEGKLYYLRGLAYRSSDWNKSIACFRKSQEINGDRYGELENYITKSLIDLARYEEAYTSAKKASAIYSKKYGVVYGPWLMYEAIALDRLGKPNLALAKINESINNCSQYLEPTDPSFIKMFYYKARILKNVGKLDEALSNCQKVFSSFYPLYSPASNTDIPDISEMTINHWVLDALKEQGDILIHKYQINKEIKHLSLALDTYKKGIHDIDVRRKLMENWDSKEQYNNFLYKIYEQALIASTWLYQRDPNAQNKKQVLYFLEKSKSTLLQENQRSVQSNKDIPPDVLAVEKKIRKSIVEMETKVLKEQYKGDKASLDVLKNNLFDLRQSLIDFKKEYFSYYPSLNTSKEYFSSQELISTIPEKTAVIAYHLSKDRIVEVAFNNTELHVNLIPRNATFNDNVLKMGGLLSDWNGILSHRKASEDSIKSCISYLNNYLLKQVTEFKKDPEHIIIMPDGLLHTIPFELLSIPGNDNPIIHDFDLSYAYTFSSLLNSDHPKKQASSFAGFAPKYSKTTKETDPKHKDNEVDISNWIALRSGLIDIPEARKNVSILAKKYGGSAWLNSLATKDNFLKNARNFDILHLGMHSQLNTHTSSLSNLVFSGENENELYLNEIQAMDIPASLVVLSACNTGVGRNIIGEGPFSLARAFFYAGTESTLMSLWQVPDAQTSQIMKLFYDHLESGLNKSQALVQAKRDYLASASVLESHPSFWSGFVLVGDNSPLTLQSQKGIFSSKLIYVLMALFLGMVCWLLFKKRVAINS